MKEQLKNAFDRMTADTDPGRVQAAVYAGMMEKTKRTLPGRRILRIAAACAAVLVMTVTVCAVAAKYLTVQVPEDGEYDYLVKVTDASGGAAKVDKKALEELEVLAITQEDIKAGNRVSRTFDTWAEAADWLDCGLLVSDLLEDDTEWGRVTLTAYADSEGNLATLSLTGGCSIVGTEENCTVMVNIPLEDWGEKYDLVVGYGEDTHSGRTTETMEYITPTGIRTEIVDVVSLSLDEEGSTIRVYDTTLHSFHEGILYQISIGGRHTESQADLAKTIADSMK